MKNIFVFLLLLSSFLTANAQSQKELEAAIRKMDSLVFNVSFNTCNLSGMETAISENFEFYHDKSGTTYGKRNFINSFANGLCNPASKWSSRRVLLEMQVFPLAKDGKIYGAVQNGIHSFYEKEKNSTTPENYGSTAKFTNLWLLENKEWKYVRAISYDHQTK
jgi:Domain of unknown function (DUF4440)